jgi:N-acetylglucosamine-6-phosphate deacetylase
MASAVRHAVRRLGVDLGDALRMASRTPATFLGLDRERGRIAPGFRADLVALDADLQVLATWIGGDVRRTEGEAVR